jgi:hypothetical protein
MPRVKETWTLTPADAQVANQIAMSAEEYALELLGALLDAVQADTSPR